MAFILSNKIEFPDTLTTAKQNVFDRYGIGLFYNRTAPDWSTTGDGSIFDGDGNWVHAEGSESEFEAACDADMATLAGVLDPAITHLVIDAETIPWYNMVGAGQNNDDVTDAAAYELTRWIYMLDSARAAMPGRKVSIYGMPEMNYVDAVAGTTSHWYARTDTLSSVFDAMDFVTPHLYNFYSTNVVAQFQAYSGRNVYNALRMAGGKPVYPMIRPVWYDDESTIVTGAAWATIMPALWAATEAAWDGASGTDTIDGILAWQYQTSAENMAHWFKYLTLYSPKDIPRALV